MLGLVLTMSGSATLCQACGGRPSSVERPGAIKLCARCAGPDPRLPWVVAVCPRCGSRYVVRYYGDELSCCACSLVWPIPDDGEGV